MDNLSCATRLGQIKRVERKEFFHGGPTSLSQFRKALSFKEETDQIVELPIKTDDVLLISQNGCALRFNIEEVPVVGAKAAGVRAMNLKADDALQQPLSVTPHPSPIGPIVTCLKRVSIAEIPATSRAKRGLKSWRELKNKPH